MKAACALAIALLGVSACARGGQAVCDGPRQTAERDVAIAAQTLTIGSTAFHPEEAPRRMVTVGAFRIDRYEVTNAEFERFVAATGYVTVAERDAAGGAVFDGAWSLRPDATWRKPFGAEGPAAQPNEPVVQVAFEDARAYAAWLGRDLPTEAEWEAAARGGLKDAEYVWGDRPRLPDGRPGANHWQGVFPAVDTGEDGFTRLAPVGCFAPNGYGLFDMAGNVWEWTKDAWSLPPGADAAAAATVTASAAPGARVIKGGSWLCADNFCLRYRPAARQPGDPSLGTNHVGFRTVVRDPQHHTTDTTGEARQ